MASCGKRLYRSLYIIPWAMPGLVTAMIWRNMFDDQSGAVNQVLRVFGLPGNVRWLQQIDPPLTWIPPYVRVPEGANPYFFLFIFDPPADHPVLLQVGARALAAVPDRLVRAPRADLRGGLAPDLAGARIRKRPAWGACSRCPSMPS